MKPTWLYSYNFNSESSKQLAQALGISRIKHENSTFRGNQFKTVINWGSSQLPEEVLKAQVINDPIIINPIVNKLSFFELMSKSSNPPRTPPWTTDPRQAFRWLAEGHQVCMRHVLTGHSANGLVIVRPNDVDALKKAPLYTRYVKKADEYRIHIAFGKVIDVQRKALRLTDDGGNKIDKSLVDFRIRNLENGFIYVRNDVKAPQDVLDQAILAFNASKIDFGAIDIIYNSGEKQAYVLEINTAPGLCNSTIQSYATAFKEALQ